jgi:transposase
MAYHYIGGDRDQQFLLPISMRDWLSEGHLAWWVIEVVETIDTARLHLLHPNDGPGRPAYDPDMMLTLLLYPTPSNYCEHHETSQYTVNDRHDEYPFA